MKEFQLDIIRFIQRLHGELLNEVFEGITYIGEAMIIIAVIAYIYFVYDKKIGKKVVYISIFSMLINAFIKLSVKAPRPIGEPGVVSIRVETAGGYSFPSGHSQNSATLFTWLSRIIKKHWFSIVGIVLVVFVMISRLYLGVHYPIDVLIGALLGWIIGGSLMVYYDCFRHPKRVVMIAMLCYLPIAFFFGLKDPTMAEEMFQMYGLFIGSFLAFEFEEKYVQFTNNDCRWKSILRYVLGIIVALGLQVGLKMIFGDSLIGNFGRYFLIAFVTLGLYPYCFKKLRF